MKTITEYEIVDHGIDGEQYFQGCGLSYTDFDDIATGIGDNPYEALDDCLESLAQDDWDTDSNTELNQELAKIKAKWDGRDCIPEPEDGEESDSSELHYYVSLRVR